ncbi:SurA N-terminal domain-containing protein [Planomonospora alba]|uniref:SurA N-terminal domain-containing protein n=1 Tax=Planomonospora alba TaxID=161354 RepID=A0ABP6MUL8_9ACTN
MRVILAAVAAGAALTACSPAQAGAVAIVGGERISAGELDAGVKEFEAARARTGGDTSGLRGSVPQAVLSNLISIEQVGQLSERNGVTVTESEIDGFLAQYRSQAGQQVTDEQIAVSVGAPPSKLRDLVRITLAEQKLLQRFGAGQDDASRQAASQKLAKEAETIKIVRNPRYGVVNPQAQSGADYYVDAGRFGRLQAAS